MVKSREIPWPRILAEGTAIVLSILLAFAIDAWWEERRDAAAQRAQLQSLLGEFKEARSQLELQVRGLENSLSGTIRILELMGPAATDEALQETRAALRDSLDIGVFTPQQRTLQDVLASRGKIAFGSADMWAMLQYWPTIMSDLKIDSRHLENNREENFVDALIRLGIPMSALIHIQVGESQDEFQLYLPASDFEVDLSALLRDPGVETVFTMRAIRSQLLIENHENALRIADEIVGQLEEAL